MAIGSSRRTIWPMAARFWLAALSLVLATVAWAQERPVVAAVNAPLAWMAERLAGGAAEVLYPVPEGQDPALWRPGIADIAAIQRADLILLNGAGFADWTARTSLPRSRLIVSTRSFEDRLIATETVTHSHGADGEHSHAATASYVWLDPALAALQAQHVAAGLKRALPGEAEAIEARLAALTGELAGLGATLAELGPLAEGRRLIATHPRYQYLARAMGVEIEALSWEAGAVPTEDQLAALRALVGDAPAVLLWEGNPGAEGRDAVQALGLDEVVFPTLAAPGGEGFLAEFQAAAERLRAVLASGRG